MEEKEGLTALAGWIIRPVSFPPSPTLTTTFTTTGDVSSSWRGRGGGEGQHEEMDPRKAKKKKIPVILQPSRRHLLAEYTPCTLLWLAGASSAHQG